MSITTIKKMSSTIAQIKIPQILDCQLQKRLELLVHPK